MPFLSVGGVRYIPVSLSLFPWFCQENIPSSVVCMRRKVIGSYLHRWLMFRVRYKDLGWVILAQCWLFLASPTLCIPEQFVDPSWQVLRMLLGQVVSMLWGWYSHQRWYGLWSAILQRVSRSLFMILTVSWPTPAAPHRSNATSFPSSTAFSATYFSLLLFLGRIVVSL